MASESSYLCCKMAWLCSAGLRAGYNSEEIKGRDRQGRRRYKRDRLAEAGTETCPTEEGGRRPAQQFALQRPAPQKNKDSPPWHGVA